MREVGKDFLGKDYETLGGALRNKQIKAALCSCAKNLAQKPGGAEKITAVLGQTKCQSYYEQLETAATQLRGVLQKAATLSHRDKKDLLKLENVLRTVVNDQHLRDTVKALREKMAIFDRLRQIMRLTKKKRHAGTQ